jgi:hypothetical protein
MLSWRSLIKQRRIRLSSSNNQEQEKKGFHLKYQDFKRLEMIIESYNKFEESEEIDFNNMPDDEKNILWKIKTIIRNMESVRLRIKEKSE